MVHLNNAEAALAPRPVTDAAIGHLRLEEQIGGYEAAASQAERIEHTYDALARLVGSGRDDIAVVENATHTWDMAFYSLPWTEGDRILTARAEYASNATAFLQTARCHGVRVDVVPDDTDGQLDVDALRSMIDERVKLIQSRTCPPRAAWSTRPPRSEKSPGKPGSSSTATTSDAGSHGRPATGHNSPPNSSNG